MASTFPHLFSPIKIGEYRIRNRMFISGHMTMMATDGAPDEQQVAYHEARARGGVGLIVTEAAAVHPSGVRSGCVIDASRDNLNDNFYVQHGG